MAGLISPAWRIITTGPADGESFSFDRLLNEAAPGFEAEAALKVLATQGVTNFTAAPTVYRAMRGANPDVDPSQLRLRCASSTGEPLTPEVNSWAEKALGVTLHDHYGQTEVGMLVNNHHHPMLKCPIRAGSMGQAMPGWTVVVLHEEREEPVGTNELGRIAFGLHASAFAWFTGYVGDPARSAERFSDDGRWYITGDTGSMDEDGYIRFSARDDDVIIMAGYRIGPFEVESVLVNHPEVAEAAVIAVSNDVRGAVVEACVVLRDGSAGSDALVTDIQQWVTLADTNTVCIIEE